VSSPLPAVLPLWRANEMAAASSDVPTRPTGFAALDAELPGGGWPGAGLIELLQGAPGHGELRLLAPSLAAASAPVLWVAPPLRPYAPALAALNLPPERLVIADPERAADAAWAAEQALRAGVLAAVLWWQGSEPVAAATLRRLHLAATEGRTPLFALRTVSVRSQSSPAPARSRRARAAWPAAGHGA
jgi:protein ImuA